MRPILAIAGTALRRFFRDRSNYFFVFIFPIMLVVLIGLQFGGDAGSARVVLVGSSDLADEVAAALRDDGVVVTASDDIAAARTLVARGRTDAVVVVEAADDEAFAEGTPTELSIIVGSQGGGQATGQQLQSTLDSLDVRARAVRALEAAGMSPADARAGYDATESIGPSLVVRSVGESIGQEFQGLGQFDLGAAQQLSLFVFLSSLAGAAFLIQSRTLGVTSRMLSGPVAPRTVIMGEALGRFAIAFAQGGYIVIGTALLFDVDWGDPLAALVLLVCFCTVSAAAAILFGALFDNANVAGGVGVGAGLVLAAIGGSMLPLELFPDSLLVVSRVTPHHWAYRAWAELQRSDGSLPDILPQIGVLLAMTAVLLALGTVALRRATQRAL